MSRTWRGYVGLLGVVGLLSGCATYHKAPLSLTPDLKPGLAGLDRHLPGGGQIPIGQPLTLQELAKLAVLNNPDLKAARAQRGIAQAELLASGLPPDPSVSGGFESLLGGPASMPALTGGLVEDISSLITYRATRAAARAGAARVNAQTLWQEWQVAARAEQLGISLAADRGLLASLRAERAVLSAIVHDTTRQVVAGNLTLKEEAAGLAALATVEASLDTQAQAQAHDRAQLDALLGLAPDVSVPLAPVHVTAVPPGIAAQALASLARRRPDLIALRYGYKQADARLRAAILSQFLPVSLGVSANRDTSGVVSAGPQVMLTLPLFNRNRGNIATARATRAALAAQFSARLDGAAGDAKALLANAAQLRGQLRAAKAQAAQAAHIAAQARHAYAAGALSARDLASLQSAAATQARTAMTLTAQWQSAEISLATLLGIGLPKLAPPHTDHASS